MSENKKIASLYAKITELKTAEFKIAVEQFHTYMFKLTRGANIFSWLFGVDFMMKTASKVNSLFSDDFLKSRLKDEKTLMGFHKRYQPDVAILLSSVSNMFPLILRLQPHLMKMLSYLDDEEEVEYEQERRIIKKVIEQFLSVSMEEKIDVLYEIMTMLGSIKRKLNTPQEEHVVEGQSIWFDELTKMLSVLAKVMPLVSYLGSIIKDICTYITKDENKDILNVILVEVHSVGIDRILGLCILNLTAIIRILDVSNTASTARGSRDSSVSSVSTSVSTSESQESQESDRVSEVAQGARGSELAQRANLVTPSSTPPPSPGLSSQQAPPEKKPGDAKKLFKLFGGKDETRKNKRTRKRSTRRKMRKSRKNKIK
jgi:hypothetical protein